MNNNTVFRVKENDLVLDVSKDVNSEVWDESKYYSFIDPDNVDIYGLKLKPLITTHEDKLECFGIMFIDDFGKYYYTGDTNDFEFV